MAFQDAYRQQVVLLIRTIPFVAEEESLALKGGTANNLFVRDMPCLSVDIGGIIVAKLSFTER